MARNKTLLSLLQDFRAEIGASTNVAHNLSTRENHVRLLQRVQETLYDDHDWSHLRVRRDIALQAGQRYYDPPADISIERLEVIDVRYGDQWCRLADGITLQHYAAYDPDLDQRSWPVERWMVYEGDQIEIWPVPASNAEPVSLEGTLRMTGIRKLRPLVADDDTADLDDRLITLFAAADELASRGSEKAPLVLAAATQRLRMLIGNHSKTQSFRLFGNAEPAGRIRRGPHRVHYRVNET
jgi:hypothetical protein